MIHVGLPLLVARTWRSHPSLPFGGAFWVRVATTPPTSAVASATDSPGFTMRTSHLVRNWWAGLTEVPTSVQGVVTPASIIFRTKEAWNCLSG